MRDGGVPRPPAPIGEGSLAPLPSRRLLLGGALTLAACRGEAQEPPQTVGPLPPLRQAAPFPVGAAINTGGLGDPAYTSVLLTQFDQVTADWEMKMEVILKDDGGFDFSRADAIAGYAARHGLRLHGHNLIWYVYRPAAFLRIQGDPRAFASAYEAYITAVAGRYRGQAVGWDVVNEPVAEDGAGYRACLWREAFGMDYVARALEIAHAAAPEAVLFINDYNLESNPQKRAAFLRLAEDLLRRGAPLGGLGTQTHLDMSNRPGQVSACIADLARLGLPIHVSELDVSTRNGGGGFASLDARLQTQARRVGETAQAFAALPARQRYAITSWGVRDQDSWLRRGSEAGDGSDRPLLFDDNGRPKPAAQAFVHAVSGRA